MFRKELFLLITFCFYYQLVQPSRVTLICDTKVSSCNDSTKYCDITCELPTIVKFDDLLDIEQVIGTSNDEIKSTKSLLSIRADGMTENLPGNIGNAEANFTTFHKFSVTKSKLKFIKPMDFFYMKNITELDLSKNQIEMLPNGVFDNLIQLETLLIQNNKISYLPCGMLAMLTRLKNFYAQHNQIKQVYTNSFSNNKRIERIFLQNNALVAIDEQFDQLIELSIVDLRENADFCQCKVMDEDESRRKKNLCENDSRLVEVQWKNEFKNCSMNQALQLQTTTIGPCAVTEVIRMYNAQLLFEICVWDYEEKKKLSNAEAVGNCTILRRIEEQNVWTQYDACVVKKMEINDRLNEVLQSCYSARNSTINEAVVTFNSCSLCTKMTDNRNVEKCKLLYMKDHGDNHNDFQHKVSSLFGKELEGES